MEEVKKELNRILVLVIKIAAIPVLSLALVGNWEGLRGFLLGLSVAIITFMMMARNGWKITGMPTPAQGQAAAISGYLVRMCFYALTMVVAIVQPNINPYAAVVGLVMLKYTLIGEGLVKQLVMVFGRKNVASGSEKW